MHYNASYQNCITTKVHKIETEYVDLIIENCFCRQSIIVGIYLTDSLISTDKIEIYLADTEMVYLLIYHILLLLKKYFPRFIHEETRLISMLDI